MVEGREELDTLYMSYVKLAYMHQQTSTMLEKPLRTTCGISTATHSSISADDGSNFTGIYKWQRPTYTVLPTT